MLEHEKPVQPRKSPEREFSRGFTISKQLHGSKEVGLWRDGLTRELLPIDGRLAEILSEMDNHQVVIVEAETGAGKTTRIPQAILTQQPDIAISMTQTRRLAVSMNGDRIASEMGEEPGGIVGWKLRGEDPVVSDETRLILTVDQTLVNKIRTEGKLPEGVIIVDEAHERNVSTDLLLGLIKEYLPNSPKTKILITSATIDTQKFNAYFADSSVVSVKGRMYPVEVLPYRLSKYEHHSEGAAAAALGVMRKFYEGKLTILGETADAPRRKITTGSVAVLLPGKEDIRNVMERIEREARQLGIADEIEIVECHGETPRREQKRLEKPAGKGKLRFIVATEVIRSSVTVGDMVGLIDSLQIKRLITDKNGVAHLDKIAVSKAEADQAKGRTGRTQPGLYIPVSFEQEYERLNPWPEPAVLREPIASIVLQVAAVGLNARTFSFIDRPEEAKIDKAFERLKKIGALSEDETITELGRTLLHFPLDPESARSLLTAETLGVLPEAMVVTAIMENDGIFYMPGKRTESIRVTEQSLREILAKYERTGSYSEKIKPEDVDITKERTWVHPLADGRFLVTFTKTDYESNTYHIAQAEATKTWKVFAGETESDFVAAVNAYRTYRAQKHAFILQERASRAEGSSHRFYAEDALREWCVDTFLNFKKLELVDRTLEQMQDDIKGTKLRFSGGLYNERAYNADDLTKALASGSVDNVHRMIVDNRGQGHYNGALSDSTLGDPQISDGSACRTRPEYLFLGGVRKATAETRKGTRQWLAADMVAPIKPEWLPEVMPQACVPKLQENSLKINEDGTISGTEDTFYGSVVIKSIQRQITGAQGAEVLARFITNGWTKLPCESANDVYIREFENLGNRIGKKFDLKKRLEAWYKNQLGDVSSVTDAQKVDLALTDERMTQILGVDYAQFRDFIKTARPDTWNFGDITVPLVYDHPGHVHAVVAEENVGVITQDSLPNWPGYSVNVKVFVGDESHSIYIGSWKLAELKDTVEEFRQKTLWEAFISDEGGPSHSFGIKQIKGFPQLPEPKVWDRRKASIAYPGYEYRSTEYGNDGHTSHTIWSVSWFKTREEAQVATQKAREILQQVEDTHYSTAHDAELREIAKLLDTEIKDTFDAVLAEPVLYGLSKEEIQRYSGSCLKDKYVDAQEQLRRYPNSVQAVKTLTYIRDRLIRAKARFDLQKESEKVAGNAMENLNTAYESFIRDFGRDNDLQTYRTRMEQAMRDADYVGALELANQAKEVEASFKNRLERRDKGELFLNVEVSLNSSRNGRSLEQAWAIQSNGSILEGKIGEGKSTFGDLPTSTLVVSHWESNYGYVSSERWSVHCLPSELSPAQRQTLQELDRKTRKYFTGGKTGWNTREAGDTVYVTERNKYPSDYRVDQEGGGLIDVSQWEVMQEEDCKRVYANRIANPYEALRDKTQRDVDELEKEVAWQEQAMTVVHESYEKSIASYLARLDTTPGEGTIEEGTIFEIDELRQVEPEPGKKLLQTPPMGDGPSKTNVVLVLDPQAKENRGIGPGKTKFLVKVVKSKHAPLKIFTGNRRDNAGNKLSVTGYLVQVIPSPETSPTHIENLKERLQKAREELANIVKKISPPKEG